MAQSRGHGLPPCPLCGAEEASVSVSLADVTADDAFRCGECDGDFSIERLRQFIGLWTPVIAWIETAPVLEE